MYCALKTHYMPSFAENVLNIMSQVIFPKSPLKAVLFLSHFIVE